MYEFGRFGVLIKHDGLPLYAGRKLISKYKIVWWFPLNWVFLLFATLEFIRRELILYVRNLHQKLKKELKNDQYA